MKAMQARTAQQPPPAATPAPPVLRQGNYLPMLRRQVPAAVPEVDVWGFRVTPEMCDCRPDISLDIDFAKHMRDVYRACDTPANTTSKAIDVCVDALEPNTQVGGTTSATGDVGIVEQGDTPCDRVREHATRVHEHFHLRQQDEYAERIGGTFLAEWQRLSHMRNRLDLLRHTHPNETAAFLAFWNSGHERVLGEVDSHAWEARFLSDVYSALTRICP